MRRWQSLIIMIGFFSWFVTAGAAQADDRPVTLKVVTEINPPNQYMADGKLTGPLVEIVQTVLEVAQIKATIEVLPWARAVRVAQEEQNVLIFSLGRTAERESHFKWVGQNLASVREHGLNYAKLKAGRIDLWPASQDMMSYEVRNAGDDPAKTVKPVLEITDLSQGYTGGFLASSLSTPDDIVERLRQALDQMKRDGRYAAIHKKWQ
jgi:polar amino acid transport system substrate-binding protein